MAMIDADKLKEQLEAWKVAVALMSIATQASERHYAVTRRARMKRKQPCWLCGSRSYSMRQSNPTNNRAHGPVRPEEARCQLSLDLPRFVNPDRESYD